MGAILGGGNDFDEQVKENLERIIKGSLYHPVTFLENAETSRLNMLWDISKIPEGPVTSSLGKSEYEVIAHKLLCFYRELGRIVGLPVAAFANHIRAETAISVDRFDDLIHSPKLFTVDHSRYLQDGDIYIIPTNEFFKSQTVGCKRYH